MSDDRKLVTIAPGLTAKTVSAVLTALDELATVRPLSDGIGVYSPKYGGIR